MVRLDEQLVIGAVTESAAGRSLRRAIKGRPFALLAGRANDDIARHGTPGNAAWLGAECAALLAGCRFGAWSNSSKVIGSDCILRAWTALRASSARNIGLPPESRNIAVRSLASPTSSADRVDELTGLVSAESRHGHLSGVAASGRDGARALEGFE